MDLSINKNLIDKDEYPQRRRDRAPLRAHAGRPVERARTRQTRSAPRRSARRRPACSPAWRCKWRWRNRRRRPRASRPTRRTWCAARCRSCGTSSPGTGTSRCARSRMAPGRYGMDADDMLEQVDENTIVRGAHARRHLHRRSTSRSPSIAAALDELQAAHRARRRHPRRRRERRVPRTVLRARPGVGLPPAAGEVDQHLGPQVRPRAARRRLGGVARRRRAARRPGLPRQLPGRRHADVPDQLLAARPGRSSPSTTTSSGSAARATAGCTAPPTRTAQYLAEEIPSDSARSSCSTTAIRRRRSRRSPGSSATGADPGYTLYDLADRLRTRGWQVPAYPLTGDLVRRRSCSAP